MIELRRTMELSKKQLEEELVKIMVEFTNMLDDMSNILKPRKLGKEIRNAIDIGWELVSIELKALLYTTQEPPDTYETLQTTLTQVTRRTTTHKKKGGKKVDRSIIYSTIYRG